MMGTQSLSRGLGGGRVVGHAESGYVDHSALRSGAQRRGRFPLLTVGECTWNRQQTDS